MDLSDKKTLKKILSQYSIYPKKSLGQNFLINKSIVEKICDNADLSKKDTVIEIGPGAGVLTTSLSEKVKRVIAVEKDRRLIPLLEDILQDKENTEIVNEDILNFDVPVNNYKVVANLPYYITSPIIRKFLEEKHQPQLLLLTIQKEVAERIVAKPPNMSILAVAVQFYAHIKIVSHLPPGFFWPSPSVSSSIIKIIPKKETGLDEKYRKAFFKIIRKGFSHPRKQLLTNFRFDKGDKKKLNLMKKGNISALIEKSGVSPKSRAESLTIENWKELARNFSRLV